MRLTLLLLAGLAAVAVPARADICAQAEMKADGKIPVEKRTDAAGSPGAITCAFVAAPTAAVYAALTDYESFPRWLDKVDGVTVRWIDERVAQVDYEIDTFFGDWKYTLERVHDKPKRVAWKRIKGDFKAVTGYYEFRPVTAPTGTLLVMETYMDPGISVPDFVMSHFREKGARRILQDVRDEVARREKR